MAAKHELSDCMKYEINGRLAYPVSQIGHLEGSSRVGLRLRGILSVPFGFTTYTFFLISIPSFFCTRYGGACTDSISRTEEDGKQV